LVFLESKALALGFFGVQHATALPALQYSKNRQSFGLQKPPKLKLGSCRREAWERDHTIQRNPIFLKNRISQWPEDFRLH
jgi:hypothetical protein